MLCSNCNTSFENGTLGSLVVRSDHGLPVAFICPACTSGANKVKIVLARGSNGLLAYEQYAAIEMAK